VPVGDNESSADEEEDHDDEEGEDEGDAIGRRKSARFGDDDEDEEEEVDEKLQHADDEDDEDEHNMVAAHKEGDDDGSSSDENDSTAAARAAAIGHSPQLIVRLADPSTKLEASVGEPETPTASNPPQKSEPTEETAEVESNNQEDVVLSSEKEQAPVDAMDVDKAEDQPNSTEKDAAVNDSNGEKQVKVTSQTKVMEAMDAEQPVQRKKEIRYRVPPGVSLNERDDDENTPLHVAIINRKLEHVKLLLEAGASVRLRCDGSGPLHTAISVGALKKHHQFAYECVAALHEGGADLLAKDESNHTPLFLACMFNLPQIVSYILNYDDGLSTLNVRADRGGNRPLHAAAKYDTPTNPSFSKTAAANATGQPLHHHPDGSVIHPISAFPGKIEASRSMQLPAIATADTPPTSEALLTQVLLLTNGIEVDALNSLGQSALHVACMRGNWPVARLLLQAGANPNLADRRGYTPGQWAHKRGMPIPNNLATILGDPPASGLVPPLRDLIVDPDGTTTLFTHELCILHRTCAPIRRDSSDPPPENVRRLEALVNADYGILRSGEFGSVMWRNDARRAAMVDVLKVRFVTCVVVVFVAVMRISVARRELTKPCLSV
jgi:ankyrin repeat protein